MKIMVWYAVEDLPSAKLEGGWARFGGRTYLLREEGLIKVELTSMFEPLPEPFKKIAPRRVSLYDEPLGRISKRGIHVRGASRGTVDYQLMEKAPFVVEVITFIKIEGTNLQSVTELYRRIRGGKSDPSEPWPEEEKQH